jgi:hypothetical protein
MNNSHLRDVFCIAELIGRQIEGGIKNENLRSTKQRVAGNVSGCRKRVTEKIAFLYHLFRFEKKT